MLETISIVGSADTGMSQRSYANQNSSIFNYLESLGYRLTSEPTGDFLISFNHNGKCYRQFIKSGGNSNSAILIRLEPDAVFPAQYRSRIEKKYGLIISPGSRHDYLEKRFFTGWPYQYHLNPAKPERNDPTLHSVLANTDFDERFDLENWIQRPINLVMIAGNKVSPVKSANYQLRRNLVKHLPSDFIQVYGPLWNGSLKVKVGYRFWLIVFTIKNGVFPNFRSIHGNLLQKYPSVRGVVENKHTLLQQSKFSLVVENSNSFVSEKIFDCILNGAIPVYVGPNLEDVGIPIGLGIKSSGDYREVIAELNSFDRNKASEYLMEMKRFLRSDYFKENWTASFVWGSVAGEISTYINKLKS